jgi:phosphopantetheinyl transferase
MIDVWCTFSPAGVPDVLDDEERARAGRFLCPRTAATYRAAHAWKRQVLSHYRPEFAPSQWRFVANAWGKPAVAVPGAALPFNLSHSGACVALAVAGDPVDGEVALGVDVEVPRPMPHLQEIAAHVFHPAERRWLAAQGDTLPAFFRLWTLKEALLKAAGTGFSHPARALCWEGLGASWAVATFAGRRWRGATRWVDGAIVSLALPLDGDPPAPRLLRPVDRGLDPIAEPFLLPEPRERTSPPCAATSPKASACPAGALPSPMRRSSTTPAT